MLQKSLYNCADDIRSKSLQQTYKLWDTTNNTADAHEIAAVMEVVTLKLHSERCFLQ